MADEAPEAEPTVRRQRRYRTLCEKLGSIVYGFELIVIFLCALVFFGMRILPPALALGGGAAVLVLMVLLTFALRYGWGVKAGWVFHIAMLGTGFLHGGMFFVSGMFLAVWAYSMIKGGAIDRERAPIIAEYYRALAAGEIDPDGSPRTAES